MVLLDNQPNILFTRETLDKNRIQDERERLDVKNKGLITEEAQQPGSRGELRNLSVSHLGEIWGHIASIKQEEYPLENEEPEDKRDVLSNIDCKN